MCNAPDKHHTPILGFPKTFHMLWFSLLTPVHIPIYSIPCMPYTLLHVQAPVTLTLYFTPSFLLQVGLLILLVPSNSDACILLLTFPHSFMSISAHPLQLSTILFLFPHLSLNILIHDQTSSYHILSSNISFPVHQPSSAYPHLQPMHHIGMILLGLLYLKHIHFCSPT